MKPISVRLADRNHLRQIPQVELAAATMFPIEDLSRELRYKVTPPSDLQEALEDERLWVAEGDESVVGFAMASEVDGAGYIDEIGVLPAFGRRGIGRRLVSAVIDWAGSKGYRYLTLVTFSHLAWNAPFYEKLGFRRMKSPEHGKELAGLIEEERQIGINVAKRVAMCLDL